MSDQNRSIFFVLVRAGLWADVKFKGEDLMIKDLSLDFSSSIDWREVYQMAEEQSVVGLVAAGVEWIKGLKVQGVQELRIPQEWALQFVGQTLQIEQRNKAMNAFVASLIDKMKRADIYAVLVKGQGIAQCYEKPLWRSSGDVDLLLSEENYQKAKDLLLPLSTAKDVEEHYGRHIGLTIDGWSVELHGTQRCELSSRMDKVIDETQDNVFCTGNMRFWDNYGTTVFLPSPNNDVIFVFTHFVKHFFKEGVGLRQICDWCRLIWTYRDDIDVMLLNSRLRKMRLMSEWKVFGIFAVEYLGMPMDAMPFLNDINNSEFKILKKKADRICRYVMEVGNFGHNRDMSYFTKYHYFVRKAISFAKRTGNLIHHASIFPYDSLRFFPYLVLHGVKSTVRGE